MYMLKRTGILALIAAAFSASALAQYSQPVRDVENPGHFPFFGSAGIQIAPGSASLYGVTIATVPVGKRVVLEFVAVACDTAPADSITDVRIQIGRVTSTGSNATAPVPFPVARQGDATSSSQKWAGASPVKLYADSQVFPIAFGFARQNTSSSALCNIYVSGFTINAP